MITPVASATYNTINPRSPRRPRSLRLLTFMCISYSVKPTAFLTRTTHCHLALHLESLVVVSRERIVQAEIDDYADAVSECENHLARNFADGTGQDEFRRRTGVGFVVDPVIGHRGIVGAPLKSFEMIGVVVFLAIVVAIDVWIVVETQGQRFSRRVVGNAVGLLHAPFDT